MTRQRSKTDYALAAILAAITMGILYGVYKITVKFIESSMSIWIKAAFCIVGIFAFWGICYSYATTTGNPFPWIAFSIVLVITFAIFGISYMVYSQQESEAKELLESCLEVEDWLNNAVQNVADVDSLVSEGTEADRKKSMVDIDIQFGDM